MNYSDVIEKPENEKRWNFLRDQLTKLGNKYDNH